MLIEELDHLLPELLIGTEGKSHLIVTVGRGGGISNSLKSVCCFCHNDTVSCAIKECLDHPIGIVRLPAQCLELGRFVMKGSLRERAHVLLGRQLEALR